MHVDVAFLQRPENSHEEGQESGREAAEYGNEAEGGGRGKRFFLNRRISNDVRLSCQVSRAGTTSLLSRRPLRCE